jgi:hypothetical protein
MNFFLLLAIARSSLDTKPRKIKKVLIYVPIMWHIGSRLEFTWTAFPFFFSPPPPPATCSGREPPSVLFPHEGVVMCSPF